jgi:hypothetical protein
LKQRRFGSGLGRRSAGVADHVSFILARHSTPSVVAFPGNPFVSENRKFSMSKQMKRMLIGSIAASGLVAVTAIVDMVLAIPYSGSMAFDAMFLVAAGIVIYMGYETLKEST